MSKFRYWALPLLLIGGGAASSQDGRKKEIQAQFSELSLRLNRDSESKIEAAKQIAEYAEEVQACVPKLVLRVEHDRDPTVRAEAAKTLGVIGLSAVGISGSVIGALAKALEDVDEDVRLEAVGALAIMAPFSKAALPKVLPLLKDNNATIRHKAVYVVSRLGPDAKEAVPALVEALKDPDQGTKTRSSVASFAMHALGQIGPQAKEAVGVLLKLDDLKDEEQKGGALVALAKIIPKDKRLMPLLLQMLKNQETPGLRGSAAGALRTLAPHAEEAIPHLIAALKATDVKDEKTANRIKLGVIVTLGAFGPAAKDSIPAIRAAMAEGDERIQSFGKASIKKIAGKD